MEISKTKELFHFLFHLFLSLLFFIHYPVILLMRNVTNVIDKIKLDKYYNK